MNAHRVTGLSGLAPRGYHEPVMPLTDAQKLAAITPGFAGSRKPITSYIEKITLDKLHSLYTALGQAPFTRLTSSFYPDQLFSLQRDLTTAELTQLAGMTVATLQSFSTMTPQWVKSMLLVIRGNGIGPALASYVPGVSPALGGLVNNANGAIDQTSTQPSLINTIVTERNPGGAAVRNLIFNNSGNCVGEINFANHGGSATSGHAHVYPIMCVPITGHHAMGTPHIDMADYPVAWRALPGGINPATALGQ
jgi:hypothetical protein